MAGIPVTCTAVGAGFPLLSHELDAKLTAAGIPEEDGDTSPATTTVLSAPSGWGFSDETCWYAETIVDGLPGDGPLPGKERHYWLLSQNVRLACAHRLGCISETGLEQAHKLLDERFGWLVRNTAPRREPKRYERSGAVTFGIRKCATKTDDEARDELGGHECNNGWVDRVAAAPEGGNTVTSNQAAATGAGTGGNGSAPPPNASQSGNRQPGGKTKRRRKSKNGPSRLDDAHIGAHIADHYLQGRFLVAKGLGWMEFDGKRWTPTAEPVAGEAVRLALLTLYGAEVKANADAERLKKISGLFSAGRIFAILRIAKGRLWAQDADFDAHPDLLNVRNGVVNLRTGALGAHDPALRFTKLCPTNYIPGATHPDWDKALSALPSSDVADWLQVRFGQGLTGHPVPDDILVFLEGDGENGKTTVVVGIQKSAGPDYAVTLPDRVLLANTGDHPTELMTLRGARLAFMEELPEQHLNIKRLKETHGNGSISARYCGKDSVEWEPTHTIFVTTNHRPRIDDPGHAVWRRLAMVEFPYRYRKPHETIEQPTDRRGDPGLRARIKAGREGCREAVLAWLIKGAMTWYRDDLPEPPAAVVAATETWRTQVDVLLRFAVDSLVPDLNYHIASMDLYRELAVWLKANGHTAWSDQLFAARFEQHPRILDKKIVKRRVVQGAKGQTLSLRLSWDPSNPRGTLPKQYTAWVGVRFREYGDDFESET